MAWKHISTLLFSLILLQFLVGSHSATFTIINRCSYTVWPGLLSGAGTSQLSTTGFVLQPGESNAISIPTSWSCRLWGTGKFSCGTGDCGSCTMQCSGGGAAPPATLAEFTLNGAGGLDFYDVSFGMYPWRSVHFIADPSKVADSGQPTCSLQNSCLATWQCGLTKYCSPAK